ncbi:MAG: hypothetical protein C5B53_13095 [Candidatus Melainabacteria bacterium]|nr:MAG: hypothetical protein C5B53_13095 [Candidatus Melainabacteria bacterium]
MAFIAAWTTLAILINLLVGAPASALATDQNQSSMTAPEPSPDPKPVAGQKKPPPAADISIPHDLVEPLAPPSNLDPSQANFYQLPHSSEATSNEPYATTAPPAGLPQPGNFQAPPANQANGTSTALPPVNGMGENDNAIDASKVESSNPPASFPSESLIPEFNQPMPQVSAIVRQGETSGAPAQPVNSPPQVSAEQRLKGLEQSVFGLTYSEHDLTSRLSHLETETFGAVGSGSFEERLQKLELKIGGQPAFERSNGSTPASGDTPSGGALCGDNEASTIVQAIPSDEKAGDYFANIHALNGRAARWSKFPVRLHLPQASPEAWEKNLTAAVKRWNQCIPLNVVPQGESADIDVTWVNHLTPRLFGITRVVITQGRMHVQIFMLRPTFYLPEVPERALLPAFLHELGHGMGLLGHSDEPGDLMYPMEFVPGSKFSSKAVSIGARDINTLKKVYELPIVENGYTAPAPMEWGSGGKITKD